MTSDVLRGLTTVTYYVNIGLREVKKPSSEKKEKKMGIFASKKKKCHWPDFHFRQFPIWWYNFAWSHFCIRASFSYVEQRPCLLCKSSFGTVWWWFQNFCKVFLPCSFHIRCMAQFHMWFRWLRHKPAKIIGKIQCRQLFLLLPNLV